MFYVLSSFVILNWTAAAKRTWHSSAAIMFQIRKDIWLGIQFTTATAAAKKEMENILSSFAFCLRLRGEIIKYVPKSFKLNWTRIYLASPCPPRWSYYYTPCIPICISRFHICLIVRRQQERRSFYHRTRRGDHDDTRETNGTRCVNDNPSDSIATLRV